MENHLNGITRIAGLALAALALASCSRYSTRLYLRDAAQDVPLAAYDDYLLAPGDEIQVSVSSSDQRVSSRFSSLTRSGTYTSELSLSYAAFRVGVDSLVTLPVVGSVKAGGKSVEQFERDLQQEINTHVIETTVSARLSNFRVTTLGEVNRPGVHNVHQARATVFDAIAMAGELSPSADRGHVAVLRKRGDHTHTYHLDLTSSSTLQSPAYYLYPGDIVYVRPLRYKTLKENFQLYSLMLSTVTTFILVLNYLRKP